MKEKQRIQDALARLTRVQNMGSDDGQHIDNAKVVLREAAAALDAAQAALTAEREKHDEEAYNDMEAANERAEARVAALEQALRPFTPHDHSDWRQSGGVHQGDTVGAGTDTSGTAAEAHDCEWRRAIIDATIVDWVYVAEHERNPRKAVNDLCCHVRRLALDPAVSKEAHDLVKRAVAAEQAPRATRAVVDEMRTSRADAGEWVDDLERALTSASSGAEQEK